MTIDEARFRVLEQNIQAMQQTLYQILLVLGRRKLLVAAPEVVKPTPRPARTACERPDCCHKTNRPYHNGDYYGPI